MTFISDGDVLERDGVEVRAQHDALLVTAPGGLLVQAVRCAGGWDLVIWPPGRVDRGPAQSNRARLLPEGEQEVLRALVGKRVASARKALGFSQRSLAKYFNRSPSWVREIEGGAQWAPAYLLIPLAEATAVTIDWFYGRDPGTRAAPAAKATPLRPTSDMLCGHPVGPKRRPCPRPAGHGGAHGDHDPGCSELAHDPGDYPEPPEDRYDLKDHP